MSGKRKKPNREVLGAPDITHSDDRAAYIDLRLVVLWFNEMFDRVASDDQKAAYEACDALMTLLIHGVDALVGFALGHKDSSTRRWALKVLAAIANEAEICETDEVYRQEKAELGKLFRADLWFPRKPLYQAIHRELWLCWFYRRELIWPMRQRYLPNLSVKPPKEYLPLMKLPKLSLKSWRKWKDPLWRLVKKNNPDLLEKLRELAKRSETEWSYSDGVSKQQTKNRTLYWKDFETQFRNHLKAIARQWGIS
jgi:hypothetical protein